MNFSFFLSPENYVKRRDDIKNELASYDSSWRVFFYEDLVDNPVGTVSSVLNFTHVLPIKTKLNYQKNRIIRNYDQLKEIEDTATFRQYRQNV